MLTLSRSLPATLFTLPNKSIAIMKSRCQFWTTSQPGGALSDFLFTDLCVIPSCGSRNWARGKTEEGCTHPALHSRAHWPDSPQLQIFQSLTVLLFKLISISCPLPLYKQIFTVCCNTLVLLLFQSLVKPNTYTNPSYYVIDSCALWNFF